MASCCLAAACGDDASSGSRGDSTTTPGTDTTTSTATGVTATTSATPTGTSDTPTTNATETSVEASASDETTTSSGDPMFCPETHQCVPDAPEGWDGPVFVLELDPADEDDPECPDAYPDLDVDGFDGLLFDEAGCQCSCGTANGTTCENSTTLNYWADAAECAGGSSVSLTVFGGTCSELPGAFPSDTYWQLEPVEARGGACVPTTTETLSDPSWSNRVAACGGAEFIPDVCASGRICAPFGGDAPADGGYCIWRTGEHECPDDFETVRPIFDQFDDQRGCTACSCSDPSGLCDDAAVQATATANCMPPFSGTIPADNSCEQTIGGETGGVVLNTGTPTAFCAPSAPSAVGEVLGSGTTTLCCT